MEASTSTQETGFHAAGTRMAVAMGSWGPAFAFVLVICCTAFVLNRVDTSHVQAEKSKALAHAADKGDAVKRVVDRTLSAALALGALVAHNQGEIASFEDIGSAMLPLYPGASALQLAPNGITRRVVPYIGNEKSIGHDLFANPERRKEAVLARDTGKMTLAGPFPLVQGGLGAVGRYPVFLNNYGTDKAKSFWGFTSVVLRFPDVLEEVHLEDLKHRGYAFWLWRQHPETGEIQVIAPSDQPLASGESRVDHVLNMPNGKWFLSVAPIKGWRNHSELLALGLLGLFVAALVARLMREMATLRAHRESLEAIVKQRTERLALRESELQRAQEVAGIGSWVFDNTGANRVLSPNACVLFGRGDNHQLDLDTLLSMVHEADRNSVASAWEAATRGVASALEYQIATDEEPNRWIFEQIEHQAHATESGQFAMLGTLQDVTAQKAREAIIWKQANFDTLTGLANRQLFQDRLNQAISRTHRSGKRLGLVFLDLDGFKWINDSLGHLEGDELLKIIGQRLQSCVRQQDTVARLGGDEFTIIIEDLQNTETLAHFAQKVLALIREPIKLGSAMRHQTASIGLTMYPDDGDTVAVLLRNADMAMYHSKRLGKNQCRFYAPSMQDAANRRAELEAELHDALANGEFVLHYQPIVHASTGNTVGAEALLRWVHPIKGLVSPQEFLPLAEETGLIVGIGEWVFKQAVAQTEAWALEFTQPLRMSINVSGAQLRQRSFADLVRGIVASATLGRNSLQLEITETVLMENSAVVMDSLRQFQEIGLGLALDDFGTGYSSLSYLTQFAFDVLKIDKSFIDDCPEVENSNRVVEGTIRLAHSLGLKVVAEGVETSEQRAFLQSAGCDCLQGYLVSRPIPAEAFTAMLAAQTPG